MNGHPIYIVDDDEDDQSLISEAFRDLGYPNEIKYYNSAEGILSALDTGEEKPFIIISDINLPMMDGFELREKILNNANLSEKSIPFIFWSTTASEAQIKRAYDLSAHGFFLKGRTYGELKEELDEMVRYWSKSIAPLQL
jgi:CheY-like chemotaxis protein